MPHAVPADLVNYYDETVIADLASDTGTPVENLTADAKVLAALSAASGKVNSAATVAERYTVEQLAALTGDDLELLKQITCTLAMARLLTRRPGSRYVETYKESIQEAEDFLERLRRGERVFAVADVREAGQLAVDGPTVVEYERLNLLPDRTRNYYPSRASRLPTDQQ